MSIDDIVWIILVGAPVLVLIFCVSLGIAAAIILAARDNNVRKD